MAITRAVDGLEKLPDLMELEDSSWIALYMQSCGDSKTEVLFFVGGFLQRSVFRTFSHEQDPHHYLHLM